MTLNADADDTFGMTPEEVAVLDTIAARQGMSRTGVMRQALRHYQLVLHRLEQGETMSFSGDAARSREFLGPQGMPPEPSGK